MLTYQISFYDEFHCAKGSCPDTCCRGWKIPMDQEALFRFSQTRGLENFKLISHLKPEGDTYILNSSAKTCPFFSREGLCSLQQKQGASFIPLVCQRYPRRIRNYGAFVEETLELACPEACQLFLSNYRDLKLLETSMEDSMLPPRFGTNEDYPYLKQLLSARDQLISFALDLTIPDSSFFSGIIAYARAAQNACIRGDFGFFDKVYDFSSIVDNFSFSGKAVDLLVTTGLYHRKLSKRNPKLYELCRLYFKTYDSFSSEEASAYFQAQKEDLLAQYPELSSLFRAYFVYYLQSSFLTVFESYSFIKALTLGLIHLQLLELFFTLHFAACGSLSQTEQGQIISSYEKRARHNEEITDAMYQAIYEFLP